MFPWTTLVKVHLPGLDQVVPESNTVGKYLRPMYDEREVKSRDMEWFTIYLSFVSCGQFIVIVRGGTEKEL